MHLPWAQTPGVRHSFTSAGDKSKTVAGLLSFMQPPINTLRASQYEARVPAFRGAMGHSREAMRLCSLILAPSPTHLKRAVCPLPKLTSALFTNTEYPVYVLEKEDRSPQPWS